MGDVTDGIHVQNDSESGLFASDSGKMDSESDTDLDYDLSIDFHRLTGESSGGAGVSVGPPPRKRIHGTATTRQN